MQVHHIILTLFILLACRERKQEHSYEIPGLKENIKAFIDAQKCFEKPTEVIFVNLKEKNDTLSIDMVDTYPDIKELKFNYDTVIYGHRIIFTGEMIKGFNKESSKKKFPLDIIESQRQLVHEEATLWLFLYREGKLIYKDTPCAEKK